MEAYIGHLLTALVMLAGLVGVYTKIVARIQKLETRLELDDRSKSDRDMARRLEMADIARGVMKENTNPSVMCPPEQS